MMEAFNYNKGILFSFLYVGLIISTCFSSVTAQSLVPGIHALSTAKDVLFTWVILSSEKEISINLRYMGASTPPPLTIVATAYTNQKPSSIPTTIGGSQVLNASWISPSSVTIRVEGISSLYAADLITVVASPYGSSPPSIPIPTTQNTTTQTQAEAPTQPQIEAPTQTQTQNNCDPSYPDFCIPPPPPDKDCSDIVQNNFRVQGTDPHDLDRDKNGFGCDS